MVYALAPALNTILLTWIFGESEIPVWLLELKVAVSEAPLGGPPTVQLAASFQLLVGGEGNQLALAAWLV